MTDPGTISSTNSSIASSLSKCSSDFEQLNNQWEGDSFDSLNGKVGSFTKEAKSLIEQKMESLRNFAQAHKEYVKLSDQADAQRQIRADHSSSSAHVEGCHWTRFVDQYGVEHWEWHACGPYTAARSQVESLVNQMEQKKQEATQAKNGFPKEPLKKDDGGIEPFTDYGV